MASPSASQTSLDRPSPSGPSSSQMAPPNSRAAPQSRYLRRIPVPSLDSSNLAPALRSSSPKRSPAAGASPSSRSSLPASPASRPSSRPSSRQDPDRSSSPLQQHQSVQPSRSLSQHSTSSSTRRTVLAASSGTTYPLRLERAPTPNQNPTTSPTLPPHPLQTQESHVLQVDPPTSSYAPHYPPPPPPKHASRTKSTTNTKSLASQKRDAYLRHRQHKGAPPVEAMAFVDDGIIPIGANQADLRDGLLTPPMSHSSNSPTHTWDLSHELDHMDLPRNRIAKARLDETTVEPFSVDGIPSVKRIWEAGMCELVDEMGLTVKFKDLINNEPGRKTLVFFIRHFWCGQCQNFMDASIAELNPDVLRENKVDVVIVSNGHWQIIRKYREIFKCPFPIFVDGPRRLYNFLGMTRLNNDFGTMKQADRARYNTRTVPHQLAAGIGNGLFRMPLRDFGKLTQLGGEFVFGPSTVCHFAHRMSNTSDHMEAVEVAAHAGIDPELFDDPPSSASVHSFRAMFSDSRKVETREDNASKQAALAALQESEWQRDWELRREAELDRMRRKKLERRAGRLRDAGMGTSVEEEEPGYDEMYPTSAGTRRASAQSNGGADGLRKRSSVSAPGHPPMVGPSRMTRSGGASGGASGSSEGYTSTNGGYASNGGRVPSLLPPPVSAATSSVSLAEMSDAELEVEMERRRRARIRAQAEAEEAERRKQVWTEEKQEAELAKSLACVSVGPGNSGDRPGRTHRETSQEGDAFDDDEEDLEFEQEEYEMEMAEREAYAREYGQVYDDWEAHDGRRIGQEEEFDDEGVDPEMRNRARQPSLTTEDILLTASRFPVPTLAPPVSSLPNSPTRIAYTSSYPQPSSNQPQPGQSPTSADYSHTSDLTSPSRSTRSTTGEPLLRAQRSYEPVARSSSKLSSHSDSRFGGQGGGHARGETSETVVDLDDEREVGQQQRQSKGEQAFLGLGKAIN